MTQLYTAGCMKVDQSAMINGAMADRLEALCASMHPTPAPSPHSDHELDHHRRLYHGAMVMYALSLSIALPVCSDEALNDSRNEPLAV